ncbi:protein artichoke-like [Nymphalis io]|uniref:protein artichoke-like n=1 Tax=Inachis io TaxID=171585 RepID=UPI0021670A64|nr:protein artichoke-like [Nymphalis io]
MRNIIYIVLTICHIIINYSHCKFLENHQVGCSSDNGHCVTKAYCAKNVDTNLINNVKQAGHDCNQSIYTNDYSYTPIWLYYRTYDSYENILENQYIFNNLQNYISILDITFNNYKIVPNICSMPNLQFLNVSHNKIIAAKLYNAYDLDSLKEIDLSYNKIKIIDDNENEYVYRGLKKMWLSHNELIYLPDTVFTRFFDLEFLDLSYNLITNLTLLTFEGINKLKILQLSNNGIIDINSSLFRFNTLIELYLNNNKLKNVLVRDYENLNELEILDLSNNFIVNLEKNVFINLSSLKQIDLSGNLLTVIDKDTFSGTTLLSSINLSQNELTVIPTYLFQEKTISFFSIEKNNLQGSLKKGTFIGLKLNTRLDISYQSITSIEELAFFGLDDLTELLLNNNIIKSLSNNSFKTLKKLVKLDLSFNLITHIDFDKTDLLSLRWLLLHDNHISAIKKDNFESLQDLQFLDLSQNNITKIDSQSFETLGYVNNILINKNPIIGNLEAETFKGLHSVPMLDLSYTLLNIIMNASFDDMINLNYINISHSKVKQLQYNTFLNTGNIEILDLSYNEINKLSLNTTNLVNLKRLLLNNNNIIILFADIFKGMPLLNEILLSHNLIKSVDDETFKYQKHLWYLDLSFNSEMKFSLSILKEAKLLDTLILSGSKSNINFNKTDDICLKNLEISHSYIQNLSYIGLNKMDKLQSLDLSYNNMTQLENGGFAGMSEIIYIDISYNKLKLIEPGVFKDNHMLNLLNISHNNLLVLSYGVLHGLISLRVLDISYNLISNVEAARFNAAENLEELIVDHNRISDIAIEDLRSTNIKKLSIGDNPLSCEKVRNLKKTSDSLFVITALRLVEAKEENIYGITCNSNHQKYSPHKNTNVKEKTQDTNYDYNVLTEIRDILLNLNDDKDRSEGRIKDDNILNVTELLKSLNINYMTKITELSNRTLELNKEQKYTNTFLERILKVVVAMNSLNKTLAAPVKFNITSENFINFINQLRQDFDNAMILDKEKILAEVDSKIILINKRIESVITTTPSVVIPKNEKMTLYSEPKTSIFVETCVAFILLILVCLVLYKAYKSRFYIPRRRSLSTRTIPDAMDTSNV